MRSKLGIEQLSIEGIPEVQTPAAMQQAAYRLERKLLQELKRRKLQPIMCPKIPQQGVTLHKSKHPMVRALSQYVLTDGRRYDYAVVRVDTISAPIQDMG